MKNNRWRTIGLGSIAVATLALSGTALAAPIEDPMTAPHAAQAAGSAAVAHHPRKPSARERAFAADAQRYAARERANPKLTEFRGGDTIVIGATTVAVILAVVLILVLI